MRGRFSKLLLVPLTEFSNIAFIGFVPKEAAGVKYGLIGSDQS